MLGGKVGESQCDSFGWCLLVFGVLCADAEQGELVDFGKASWL